MSDLLDPHVYFRLNPYMSFPYTLDEIDPDKLEQMNKDAKSYVRRNKLKVGVGFDKFNFPISRSVERRFNSVDQHQFTSKSAEVWLEFETAMECTNLINPRCTKPSTMYLFALFLLNVRFQVFHFLM